MTRLLEKAVATARELPADLQDEIARIVLIVAADKNSAPIALSPEQRAAVAASKAAAARGEFATEEQVSAVWAEHGR